MDRLDRANMMVLSALMLAAVTIGELRIRGREAARPRGRDGGPYRIGGPSE